MEDAQPQIVKCPGPVPRVMVQEVVPEADRAIVYEDLQEETLQADAEPAEKEMINEAYTLLSIAKTGKAQRFIQDTDAPLHDESVIAVRDKSMDVGDDKVSDEDGCPSRNVTIKACGQIAAGLLDYQHVTLHVRGTPKTQDSINKVFEQKKKDIQTLLSFGFLWKIDFGVPQ